MIYRAKVSRVINAEMLDAEIFLGFGLTIKRRIWLQDSTPIADKEVQGKAVHCLVILVGGKKIFLEASEHESGRTITKVYREVEEKCAAAFKDFLYDLRGIPCGTYPDYVVDIAEYMKFLATKKFDVEDVKGRVIHGSPR